MNLKTAKGLALQDMLTEIHHYVHRSKYLISLSNLKQVSTQNKTESRSLALSR
jgi:hypothetical protein